DTIAMALTQLIGDDWSVGMRSRVSYGELRNSFSTVTSSTVNTTGIPGEISGTLYYLNLNALYNLPCGFFARGDANWYDQRLHGFGGLKGDEFWHFNAFVGYRFLQRRAEVSVGLLNIGNRDYNLSPVNLYTELPHGRTLAITAKFTF